MATLLAVNSLQSRKWISVIHTRTRLSDSSGTFCQKILQITKYIV